MADSDSIKLCECGCGQPATKRFVSGHNARVSHGMRSHGMHKTRTYGIWHGMIDRCANRNNKSWRLYGGRGISVCERWLKFENFLADMGERPNGLSLDRRDPDGNYEPGNCRWATQEQQSNNKRTCHQITALGKTQTIAQWAREIGMNRAVLRGRLRAGWSAESAVTTPILTFRQAAARRWNKGGAAC